VADPELAIASAGSAAGDPKGEERSDE